MANLQDNDFILKMFEQQQLGENVDFVIESGDNKVFVHSGIVSCSTPFLKLLIDPSCMCNKPSVLILPAHYTTILPNFISLLYTGFTNNLSDDNVSTVMSLARELGFLNISVIEEDDQSDIITSSKTNIHSESESEGSGITMFKVKTSIKNHKIDESFELSLPKSRNSRNFSKLKTTEVLDGFKGRVQSEYNQCPVGAYVGPYDQNETLNLSIQLPNSDLDFDKYSEYVHPMNMTCGEFSISQNYNQLDDLEKIDSLEFCKESINSEDEDDNDAKVYYTCTEKKCKIPCPCKSCSSDEKQCNLHHIKHLKLFDEKNHAMAIRSSEEFCISESFFSTSYVVKYAGIPSNCLQCCKDLIHHKAYHISFHDSCKFCLQNWFKLRAKNQRELDKNTKKEEHYQRTVCPYCNKRFCEPYFAEKHIKYEHGTNPFSCETCKKSFQSKQALKYHTDTQHSALSQSYKCSICDKSFKSSVSLNNHIKYVHSDDRKHCCKSCDSKFKQKKHLREHYLRVHGINQYREKYHQDEETEQFFCGHCKSVFKYKKDLNSHIKLQHEKKTKFACEQCPSNYIHKKSLLDHIKQKHKEVKRDIACPVCGKKFTLKKTLNRHVLSHE